MGFQKYRADKMQLGADGIEEVYTCHWMGGLTLSKIGKCRVQGLSVRPMVYITGEPDTYFSVPACTRIKGKYVRGYVTSDGGYVFVPYKSTEGVV